MVPASICTHGLDLHVRLSYVEPVKDTRIQPIQARVKIQLCLTLQTFRSTSYLSNVGVIYPLIQSSHLSLSRLTPWCATRSVSHRCPFRSIPEISVWAGTFLCGWKIRNDGACLDRGESMLSTIARLYFGHMGNVNLLARTILNRTVRLACFGHRE